jgi:hypothetical protein
VFTSRITRLGLISFGLLSCLLCVEASDTNSRPASLDEIQTLFNLVTVGPQRQRVVADITSYETKWSEEQIAMAIKQQNEMLPDMGRLPEAEQRDRTNAVARSHSGIQILHVQEWYSGNLYRLDQTDEGMVSQRYITNHPGTYKNSFVDIDDPALSPYRSFRVDHQLRDIQWSKTTLYAKNDLWRALGLDKEVVLPLLVALADTKSFPQGRPPTDADSDMLKLDTAKAEMIHNGSDPIWHLEAIAESGQEGRTRFILRGRIMSLIQPYEESDQEFVYVVGQVGQRPVCLEASVTNYTTHVSFFSTREDFDSQGFPHVWKRTTVTLDSPAKQIDVVFKEVELNATFDDRQVFLPVFATNYIVSDVTSGKAAILQNPIHSVKRNQPETDVNLVKRLIILCVLGLVPLWLGIRLLRYKGNKPT